MTLALSADLLIRIHRYVEVAYPEEAAGFLLGAGGIRRVVREIITSQNLGVEGVRRNRYLIGPDEYMHAEHEAELRKMDVLGVFHSHPDHPAEPSSFDQEWGQPNFSYLIISVPDGKATASKCWLLLEDRSSLAEESVEITQ